MYIAILLAAALVIGHYARPKDKQSYHMAIMAIFGIAYFCIWRFADFYLDVFSPASNSKNIAFLSLMLLVVVIGLLPWVRQIKRSFAIALVVLFGLCVVPTFVIEKNIKNTVVTWGGYFDEPAVAFKQSVDLVAARQYHDQDGGFTVLIPADWKKQTHSSGMTYFVKSHENKKYAELRPRCFHNTDTSVAEIISNMINWDSAQGMGAEKHCYITDKNLYTCFIRSKGKGPDNIQEQWRWLVMDKYQQQNIELDFVFYDEQDQSRREAEAVINSLEFLPLARPLPLCASVNDWF